MIVISLYESDDTLKCTGWSSQPILTALIMRLLKRFDYTVNLFHFNLGEEY